MSEATGNNEQDMQELGRLGGLKTKRKRGKKYFSELASKSWPRKPGVSKGGRPPGSKNKPKEEAAISKPAKSAPKRKK